jgi:hypothetical protein
MRAITYRNTKTTIPGWVDNIHVDQPFGYAYEGETHFIHFYGSGDNFHIISVGLTAIEKKSGTLEQWVKKTFGAEDIKQISLDVGESIEAVWRPSLYYNTDTFQALNATVRDSVNIEQALLSLLGRLDEIFLYIEPDINGLKAYSHKTRELLILSCTEVENLWSYYMRKSQAIPANGKTFTTRDYVKLLDKLHLNEYEFTFKMYSSLPSITPFNNWNLSAPTISLEWYHAYNKTKHDRDTHFSKATLTNCIQAVVANLIMYCVRFSPWPLFENKNTLSALINKHFDAKFINTSHQTYYLYNVELPVNSRTNLICFDSRQAGYTKPFNVLPFTL